MDLPYKFYYFNARGIGEPIRFILALANVDYEDVRLTNEEWRELKPSTTWGTVPYLTIGKTELAHPNAVGRFLARNHGLAGQSPLEEARADEIVDAITDMRTEYIGKVFSEPDEVKRSELEKEYVQVTLRGFLEKLSALKEANGGTWLVGNHVTWADIHLSISVHVEDGFDAEFYRSLPAIKAVQEAVYELPQIRDWLARRPQTPW